MVTKIIVDLAKYYKDYWDIQFTQFFVVHYGSEKKHISI